MKARIWVIMVLGLGLSGCAGVAQMDAAQQAQWVQQNCNTAGAYSTGLNQGMTPDTFIQNNFAALCPTAQQAAINASYKQGFLDGLKHRPKEVNETVTTQTANNWWN